MVCEPLSLSRLLFHILHRTNAGPAYFSLVRIILPALLILTAAPGCKPGDDTLQPSATPITESVYASGVVKAEQQYTIFSQVNGVLHEILVEAGDTVLKDQPLFVLRDIQAQLNNQNALILLQLSKAQASPRSEKLRELEEQVRVAKAAHDLDSTLLERQQRLWDQGVGSQLELEQRELAETSSATALDQARSRYADIRRQLDAAYQQAEVNYRKSEEALNEFVVRSAVNGLLYDVQRETGELITTQTPLGVAGSAELFLLELQVDEFDISRIQKGQKVKVTMESYPDEVFEAEVSRINPIMNERSRAFVVEALFITPPPRLYPFLTAEANIIIREKERALTIPLAYLLDDRFVITATGDTTEVKTGLRDAEQVEILAGIDSTSRLLKPESR